MFIDISGMDQAEVLMRLFNAADVAAAAIPRLQDRTFGPTRLLTREEAQAILDRTRGDIDYIVGRPLKLDLRNQPLDVSLYDRDHGANAAARALGIELGDPRITFVRPG